MLTPDTESRLAELKTLLNERDRIDEQITAALAVTGTDAACPEIHGDNANQ